MVNRLAAHPRNQTRSKEETLSPSDLIRLSGLALMLGCALFVITGFTQMYLLLFNPAGYLSVFGFVSPITLVAGPLVVLGLIGLYARQLEAAGILGLVAFLATFFGLAFVMGVYWYNSFVVPSIAPVEFDSFIFFETERWSPYGPALIVAYELLYLGWLLNGVSALRTRLFPRPTAVLLIVASLAGAIISAAEPAGGLPDFGSGLSYAGVLVNILLYAIIARLGFVLWGGGARFRSSGVEDRPVGSSVLEQKSGGAMSPSTLIRLCGLMLVASSVLFVISILGNLTQPDPGVAFDPDYSPVLNNLTSFLTVLVTPLEVLGLIGLYARRPQAAGVFGLVAFVVTLFGGMMHAGASWYGRFVEWPMPFDLWLVLFPEGPWLYTLGFAVFNPLYLLGWALVGMAFLRARLYPRPAVLLLIAVSLAYGTASVASSVAGLPEVGSVRPSVEMAIGVFQNVILAWFGFLLWSGWSEAENLTDVPAESPPVAAQSADGSMLR